MPWEIVLWETFNKYALNLESLCMRKIQLYKELKNFVHGEYEEVQVYLKLNEIHLANFSALREQE